MMKRVLFFSLACSLLSASVHAQDTNEAPPNEPPYTKADDEFSNAPGQELKAGKTSDDSSLSKILNEGENAKPAPAPSSSPEVTAAPSVPERTAAPPAASESAGTSVLVQDGKKSHYIHHPQAAKGLQLIDRDGSYYYKPETFSKHNQSSSLKVGSLQPGPNIVSADQQTDYQRMYGGTPVEVLFDYDWKPFQSFGQLGVQLGFGFFTAQGAGRFGKITADMAANNETTPHEQYTFYSLPLSAGVLYRFQYMDRQWVAPYVSGGLTYHVLAEVRDDGKAPNIVGSPAFYGAGGLMLNISAMDRETGFAMDAEYGIHTLWLNLEARQVQSINKALDLSGTLFSLGFAADY